MRFDEAVADIAAAAGRELRFVPIPMEAFRVGLDEAGVPIELADLYESLFTTVLDGRNAHVTDGVQRALGRPARDFRDYAREAAARGAWEVPLTHATTMDSNV